MALIFIHSELVEASRKLKAECGALFDEILEADPVSGEPPVPYLQGYPTVMYDAPAYRRPETAVTRTNPDGTPYQVLVPAFNVPARKEALLNPESWSEIQSAVDSANKRAAENPPQ